MRAITPAIRGFATVACSLAVLSLYMGGALAQSTYADKALADAATTFTTHLAKSAAQASPKKVARDWRADADRLLATPGTDARAAVNALQVAVGLDAQDAGAWHALARSLLQIKSEAMRQGEQTALPDQARWAAYRAYELAKTPQAKAAALATLAEAQMRRAAWRGALNAYAASLALQDVPAVRAAYEKTRTDHGFRIVDTRIDADASQPRACVVFSEALAGGQVDWASFVKIDGREAQAVSTEGKQLCVDGLTHGKSYKVTVRAGAPSVIAGEPLQRTVDLAVYVRDKGPSLRAAGKAYVLPATGQQGIPLTTTNTELLGVEVYRIGDRGLAPMMQNNEFGRTVHSYELEAIRERTGQKVYEGELVVSPGRLNEEVTTAFPVSEAIPKLQPGVYLLKARVLPKSRERDDGRTSTSQWFVVSDLGLSTYAGDDGVHAFVRSLVTAGPAAGVTVRLVARNNEVLGTAQTDARGYARFDARLHKGEGGLAPALLTAETADGDYAFLDMAATPFDLTDRGVKGRNAPGPIDGYAYADRGVYRPGETVHLTTLVRDAAAQASSVPVTLVVTRPDGVEHRRIVLPDQGLGGRTLALPLGGNAMTGTWRAKVYTDPKADPVTSAAFLVEDFQPERMDLKLTAASPAIVAEAGGKVSLAGKYLYGPPAAGLATEGEVVVRAAKNGVPGFAGYHFGKAEEKFTSARAPIDEMPETAADGTATVAVKLPDFEKTARPLEADVIVRLRESSGRTIERTLVLPVDLKQTRIGIRPSFADMQAKEGDDARFDVVMVDGSGKPVAARGLKWELSKLEQRWQWFTRGGESSYEAQQLSRRVATGTLDTDAATPAAIAARLDWGRYRLDVSSADGKVVSNIVFSAGWYADEAADSPEMLDVALDKPSYKVGDTARVRINSRVAGRALVSVMSGGVHSFEEADIAAGGGEVRVPVSRTWGAGAYVAVTLFRPLDGSNKRMPGRAIGLRWLPVEQDTRTLKVAIDAPDKVKPGALLTVPVKVDGVAPGGEARLTLAAVDVGILNLTRFEAPKPEGWFFGQRKLGLDVRDYYSRLIDGMRAEKGRLRSGGDGSDGTSMSAKGSPPVEATLALFSGIVTVGADGIARVPLQLPDFNGAIRLSAVAWSKDQVGSVSKDVIVRDTLALTVSAPRFLTLGDTARLAVDLHNVEGPAADYKLSVTLNPIAGLNRGPQSFGEKALALKAGEKKADTFTLKPTDIGAMPMTVTATGPGGLTVTRALTFDVRPPAGDIRRATTVQLTPKGGKLVVSSDVAQDLIPSSVKATVHVGPLARLDVAGVLNQLDRYPYGCAEQTTSRALPLLYANDVARLVGMGQDADLKERIGKAIERLFEMQDASGAFGIWGPADGDLWLTSYVTDFLLRAKEGKFAVDPRGLRMALDRLQNFVAYAQDVEKDAESRAYALYVLARGGRTPSGELRYFIDGRLAEFKTPLALAHLGAAASLLGDKPRAETAFRQAMTALGRKDLDGLRQDYGSSLRDHAAVVTLASETKVEVGRVPQLVDVLAAAYAGKAYTSTQEQAWLLLAARSLAEQADGATLTVGGTAHNGRFIRALSGADLKAGPLTVVNEAETPTSAVVSVLGSALTPEPAVSKGLVVTRAFYTLDGKKVDMKSADGGSSSVKQNDRFVVVVKVEATEVGGRILLVDRLPAGFEIENPRLVDSGDVKSLDWLKTSRKPEHVDFRDDRFVAAFDFFGNEGRRRRNGDDDDAAATRAPAKEATVAYIVRAVTPGSFVHPAATAEDMYRPDRHARTSAGRLDVAGK